MDCRVRDRSQTLNFYVAETDQASLLSAESCESLSLLTVNLVNHIDTEAKPLDKDLTEYANVFQGLGSFPGEYKIKIDTSVKPVQYIYLTSVETIHSI